MSGSQHGEAETTEGQLPSGKEHLSKHPPRFQGEHAKHKAEHTKDCAHAVTSEFFAQNQHPLAHALVGVPHSTPEPKPDAEEQTELTTSQDQPQEGPKDKTESTLGDSSKRVPIADGQQAKVDPSMWQVDTPSPVGQPKPAWNAVQSTPFGESGLGAVKPREVSGRTNTHRAAPKARTTGHASAGVGQPLPFESPMKEEQPPAAPQTFGSYESALPTGLAGRFAPPVPGEPQSKAARVPLTSTAARSRGESPAAGISRHAEISAPTSTTSGRGARPDAPSSAMPSGEKQDLAAHLQQSMQRSENRLGNDGPAQSQTDKGAWSKAVDGQARMTTESFGAEVRREPFGAEVRREPFGAEVRREPFGAEVRREPFGAEVPRESFGAEVPRESFGAEEQGGSPVAGFQAERKPVPAEPQPLHNPAPTSSRISERTSSMWAQNASERRPSLRADSRSSLQPNPKPKIAEVPRGYEQRSDTSTSSVPQTETGSFAPVAANAVNERLAFESGRSEWLPNAARQTPEAGHQARQPGRSPSHIGEGSPRLERERAGVHKQSRAKQSRIQWRETDPRRGSSTRPRRIVARERTSA